MHRQVDVMSPENVPIGLDLAIANEAIAVLPQMHDEASEGRLRELVPI